MSITNEIKNVSEQMYRQRIAAHGESAKGVDWKDEHAQLVRLEQLSKVVEGKGHFSMNDLGCGLSPFPGFLRAGGHSDFTYRGYDILELMVEKSAALHQGDGCCTFHHIADASQMQEADYTVASGIFHNTFGRVGQPTWLEYVLKTLVAMNTKSRKGFAFNALTQYSDPEFMKPNLYYADPCFLFDFCKRNLAKDVALLHDYRVYEFTILVRK